MIFRIAAATAGLVLLGSPALAGKWDEEKALCIEAISTEAGVDASVYSDRLVKARQGGVNRLTVELTPTDGASSPIVAECRIRGKTVREVEIKT